MSPKSLTDKLAVCSWSLQPTGPMDLIEKLRAVGIMRVQLALDPLRASPEIWGETESLFRQHGVTVASGMLGCVGEDYSTLESIRLTGGLAPDASWDRNVGNFKLGLALAKTFDVKLVTFHAGFLPPDKSQPDFRKMRVRLETVAELFRAQGVAAGLETGQESATELAEMLREVGHPSLGVNFDPANMILYDKGDPVAALILLASWIRQIHIKDARRTTVPGTWGREVPTGAGEVNWKAFFEAVKKQNPDVNFAIEREAGDQRVADIRTARALVEMEYI